MSRDEVDVQERGARQPRAANRRLGVGAPAQLSAGVGAAPRGDRGSAPAAVLRLQRALGNRATRQLVDDRTSATRQLQRAVQVSGALLHGKRLLDLLAMWRDPRFQALAADADTFWTIPSAMNWEQAKKAWPLVEGKLPLGASIPADAKKYFSGRKRAGESRVGFGSAVMHEGRMSLVAQLSDLLEKGDPRLQKLIEDPGKWVFGTEKDLLVALDKWPPGSTEVPPSFNAYRVWPTPDSLTRWPPPEPTTAENYKKHEGLFSAAWGACGPTAASLLGRLNDLGVRMEQRSKKRYAGSAGGKELIELIGADVKQVTLLNIYDPSIHEFTLELHPDGKAVLHQGYIGAYSALWFAGLQELSDEELRGTLSAATTSYGEQSAKYGAAVSSDRLGTLKKEIMRIRDEYGRGQVLDRDKLRAFAETLGVFVGAGHANNPTASEAWKRLPFQPAKDIAQLGARELAFEVATWVVTDRGPMTAEWMTSAVLRETADWWAKIAKFSRAETPKEKKDP